MRRIGLMVLLLSIVGCGDNPFKEPVYLTDKTLQRQLFFECLERIPSGPKVTTYNDWAEVVEECGRQTTYLARRCVDKCRTYRDQP